MRIVVWWSFFTAATGWAWSFASLVVTRFLFGAGEAGCFPNLTKAFTVWLPQDERVRAQGIMWLSARWGGAFTPFLVVMVFQWVSWRRAFEIFGGLGADLGRRVLLLVPRQPARKEGRQRRRTRAAAAATKTWPAATPTCRG